MKMKKLETLKSQSTTDMVIHHVKETVLLVLGSAITLISLPYLINMVGSTLLSYPDNYFSAKEAKESKEGRIPLTQRIANYVNRKTKATFEQFVAFKEDYYFISWAIFLGVIIPLLFALGAYHTKVFGFSWLLCIFYHIFRTGPNQVISSWSFALSHKEGHMDSQVYKNTLLGRILGNIYNWYIGVFYGFVPQSTYYGHCLNHHKYSNRQDDLISSSDRPRDSILNYLRYVPRFTSYSFNLYTVVQFYKEKHYDMVPKIAFGTLYWLGIVAIFYHFIGWEFALGYVVYPCIENNFIFSGFAWGWHAFIDPEDPENEFINSITIVDGEFNHLNEGYHVVHHQYPSLHWSLNQQLFEKHKEEYYKGNQATMFTKIEAYSLFLLIIFKRYDILAQKMAFRLELSVEEKKELLKTRLNTCTWGPLTNTIQKRYIDLK